MPPNFKFKGVDRPAPKKSQPKETYNASMASIARSGGKNISAGGSTTGLINPTGYERTISSIPPEADFIEKLNNAVDIVHAANPNNLRLVEIHTIPDTTPSDEEIYEYDMYKLMCNLKISGSSVINPRYLHIALIWGPSTATFTAGDYDPQSGFKAALGAAISGAIVTKFLPVIVIKNPLTEWWNSSDTKFYFEGHVHTFEIDLKTHVSQYMRQIEIQEAKGNDKGIFKVIALFNGPAATTDKLYSTLLWSRHVRNRRVR